MNRLRINLLRIIVKTNEVSRKIRKSFKDRRRRLSSSYRFPREFQNKMERIETKRRDEEEDETSEMRERIDREEKKSTISSKGGRLVAAHSGHRTSEEPELVGTQDAYKSDNGGPARGPPGPVLQVDNKGLPRRVRRRRSYRERQHELQRETKRVCKSACERKIEDWKKE